MLSTLILSLFIPAAGCAHSSARPDLHWGAVHAKDRHERSALVNLGFSIETVKGDTAYGFAPEEVLERVRKAGFAVHSTLPARDIRALDFPGGDAVYHNYEELTKELDTLAKAHPTLAHKFSIGKSLEGREIWALRIGSQAVNALGPTALPGIVFMGGHHAREHLSVEVPLLLAKHLLESRDEATLRLLDRRDIYIIPMVNPDGAEFDIASGSYQMWRKNRDDNAGNSCKGVDLNRNYSFQWGTGGSSDYACSDVYMGPQPFSEPETIAVKAFVENRPNLKILLSFHTYSELILYPWGHTYDDISKPADLAAYKKMAETMAAWNGYTPQPTHELYIASGDTTDWAYGTHGIFSFTFELSPGGGSWGGFYPGPEEIGRSFQANVRPALYLIDLADDPHRSVTAPATTFGAGVF